MTKYHVHIYREMRLSYEGIEAATPEAAAAIARDKLTGDADDIDDCDGETFAALVDVAGDEEYGQSRTIDFKPERHRKAAPKLLAALVDLLGDMPDVQDGRCVRCGREYVECDDEPIPTNCPSDDCPGYQARAAIAEAETAGITPAPGEIDVHALLARSREIAVVWAIEDVQNVRPDLTKDQCWEVLQQVRRYHDATLGINWDVLECNAQMLFGDAPKTDEPAEE